MAEPQEKVDPRELKMQIKQAAREKKMKKKQKKREAKIRKLETKKRRKEEKLRAKMAAKGISLPKRVEGEEKPTTLEGGEKIPEAEIITAEADVWEPQSARNLSEIQKRIDRMDQKSIKSLKDRYKNRYGEDLEVPDAYNVESTIEIETAEETGEIEKTTSISKASEISSVSAEEEKQKKSTGLFRSKKDKTKTKEDTKIKMERPLRLFDYRSFFYFRDKYGASGGGGKRAGLAIVDIILNIIFTIIIVKIITTIIYVIKDRREEKLIQSLSEQSSKPQPST